MLVELVRLAVFSEETAEDAHSSNPDQFDRHSGVCGTLSLTGSGVATLSSGLDIESCSGPGVNSHRLANDQTVFDQTTHLMTRIRVGNVGVLVGVKPDFVFAALHDGSGEALLEDQGAHDAVEPEIFYLKIKIKNIN
jgi:hypothetical protein